jgi:hypothetical protein
VCEIFLVFSDYSGGNATQACDNVWNRIVYCVLYAVCYKTLSCAVKVL